MGQVRPVCARISPSTQNIFHNCSDSDAADDPVSDTLSKTLILGSLDPYATKLIMEKTNVLTMRLLRP